MRSCWRLYLRVHQATREGNTSRGIEDADQDAFQDADVSMVVDYTRIATVVVARKLFQVALQKACAFAQGQPRQACASQARELLCRLALQTGRMLSEPRFLSRKGPQVATIHVTIRQLSKISFAALRFSGSWHMPQPSEPA